MKNKNFFLKIGINVFLLGIVSLLTDLSSELIHPLLPAFIFSLGGGGMAVGLIGGLGDALAHFLKVFSGYLSDRWGKRKALTFWGYFISSVSKFFLAFSSLWSHVLILRSMDRVGKGIRTAPRDAIIAESSPLRGRSFGFHRAFDTLGAIGGSFLAFILFYWFRLGYRPIFILSGIVGFSALIPFFWVKEKEFSPHLSSFKITLKRLSPTLRKFIFISSLFSLGNISYMFFLLRIREAISEPRLAVSIPILYYLWFNTIYTLFSFPAGILSDRVGRKPLLLLGWLFLGGASLGLARKEASSLLFILFFALYGLFQAFWDGQSRALVSDLAKEEIRGTALGSFHTLTGLFTLPGNLLAGFFWQFVGYPLTFLWTAGVCFVSAGLLFFLLSRKNRDTS